MEKVVISGGSGMVGSKLTALLLEKGYEVIVLSRNPKPATHSNMRFEKWNPAKNEIKEETLASADHVVNLAGANVAGQRWNDSYKNQILKSRIQATTCLTESFQKVENHQIKSFISASAVGIYGSKNGSELLEEDSKIGDDFLAKVCKEWEEAAVKAQEVSKIRTSILRIGIVLHPKDGAMEQMIRPIKFGVGAPLGNGKQIVPWIHIEDLARLFVAAIEKESMQGVYNAVAPMPVSNQTLTQIMAKKLKKPLLLPNVPGFALQMLLGEFAQSVLANLPVSARKVEQSGFEFNYPDAESAVAHLLETYD